MTTSTPARTATMSPSDSARIHAIYRALARGLELDAIRHQPRRHLRAAVGLACLVDFAEWTWIRRSRLSLASRLLIDLADAAFWAGLAKADLTTAMTGVAAVDFEAGVLMGPRGLVVPLLATTAACLARLASGEQPDAAQGVPHVGAVIGGVTVRRGERLRLQRAREVHRAELSAKRVRAFLAGQHDVALGASTVIDQLKPVAILLQADAPGSVLNQIRAGWRESLAIQAQQHAVFLDSAVRMWEQLHNDHPDLGAYVDVTVAEGDGVTLLTGTQARALAEVLDARNLRGRVDIRVPRGTADDGSGAHRGLRGPPGRAFRLLVNDESVEVPADPAAPVDRFNPAPPAFFFGAWACLMPTRSSDGALPVPLALICSAAYVAVGLRFLGQAAETAAKRAQWAGICLAALQGAVCAAGCTVRRDRLGRSRWSRACPATTAPRKGDL